MTCSTDSVSILLVPDRAIHTVFARLTNGAADYEQCGYVCIADVRNIAPAEALIIREQVNAWAGDLGVIPRESTYELMHGTRQGEVVLLTVRLGHDLSSRRSGAFGTYHEEWCERCDYARSYDSGD